MRISERDLQDISCYPEKSLAPVERSITQTKQYIRQTLRQLPAYRIPDNWDDVLSLR